MPFPEGAGLPSHRATLLRAAAAQAFRHATPTPPQTVRRAQFNFKETDAEGVNAM